MSYIRMGHDLEWFEDKSQEYIFPHTDGFVEDYDQSSQKAHGFNRGMNGVCVPTGKLFKQMNRIMI
jgi:hypothetical protein